MPTLTYNPGCTERSTVKTTTAGVYHPNFEYVTNNAKLQQSTRQPLRDHPMHLRLHSYTPAQLIAVDAVLVLIAFAIGQWVPPLRTMRYHGTAAHVLIYGLWFAVSVTFLFRRRYPKATLGVLLTLLIAGEYLRSPATASSYLLFAVFSVVVTSTRRTGMTLSALALLTTVAGVILGGDNLVSVPVASLAGNIFLGWLVGEYVRAQRCGLTDSLSSAPAVVAA